MALLLDGGVLIKAGDSCVVDKLMDDGMVIGVGATLVLLIGISVDGSATVGLVGVRTTDLEPITCTSFGSWVDSSSDE